MSPERLKLVEAIIADVRKHHPVGHCQCEDHPECTNRVTWVYPFRGNKRQRYYCDEHLPPQFTDIHTLADVDLYRLLDQLDALEAEERRAARRKPKPSLWTRILKDI